MILERVYDLDPKMHGNMHGREYMYKPVSKGELKIFIVKRNGDNGSEFK